MLSLDGKILLDEDGMIKRAANGHGGTLNSMEQAGILEDMKEQGIEWIFINGVDKQGIEVVHEYAPREAKQAITGNGAASKEQVEMMIRKTLDVEIKAEHLDATDALAIALCHYYSTSSPLAKVKSSSSWEKFIQANPDRVK